MIRRWSGLTVLLTGMMVFQLHAQTDTPNWTFNDLQLAVANIEIGNNPNQQEQPVIHSISQAIGQLRTRYLQKFGDGSDTVSSINHNLSKEYSRSIDADFMSLRQLPTEQPKRLMVLKDIQADLVLKVSFNDNSLALSGTFPSVISVTVNTVNSQGTKVAGLWVRCNPQRYGVTKNPLFVFNSASTPTSAMLPPGRFIMWVEDANNKVLASQPVDFGSGGKSAEQMTFALP